MSTEQNASKELAVVDQRADTLRREMSMPITPEQEMAAMLGGGLLRELHTFNGNEMDIWAKIQESSGDKVKPISGHLNIRIDLIGFYVHEVDITDETTGEISRCIRTALYDQDGTVYECVSNGVAKDIWRLMQYKLIPSVENPLAIKVVQIQLRGPNRMYRINQWKD